MSKCTLGILLMFTLFSCGEATVAEPISNDKDESGVETPASPEKKEEQIQKTTRTIYPRLNDGNCVDFLTEYGKKHPETRVLIHTNHGDIEVELFEETPLHRANFLYLIERNYYNPTEIVRVVKNFVVQGGNSEEVEPAEKRFMIGDHTIPAEFRPSAIHLKGALAMSRSYENNPDKRSSAYDFYIVHGRKMGLADIYDAQKRRSYTDDQIEAYKTRGGAIHLDEEHTVFGRVVKGLEVVDRIASVETDKSGWPRHHIEVRMEVLR